MQKFSFAIYVFNSTSNWRRFTLSFWKNHPRLTLKVFNIKFGPRWKDRKSSYQGRQILALFCKLAALILDLNYVKGFPFPKNIAKIKIVGVWDELEAKNYFPKQLWTK